MSVRIKSALMKVKNSNGEYVDLDTLAVTQTTQEAISEIESAVAGVQDIVDDAETRAATVASTVSAAETAITNLNNQKNDIVQSVASMAELGTDTTLTVAGMAADAKATGDAVNGLKSALVYTNDILEENVIQVYGKNMFNPLWLNSAGIVNKDGESYGKSIDFAYIGLKNLFVPQNESSVTLSFEAYVEPIQGTTGAGVVIKLFRADGTTLASQLAIPNNTSVWTEFSITVGPSVGINGLEFYVSSNSNNVTHIRKIQVEKNSEKTTYENSITAVDKKAEDLNDINANNIALLKNDYNTNISKITGIIPPTMFESGNITFGASGFTYSASSYVIRTPENNNIHLYPGDTIKLSDYTDLRFYVGWIMSNGTVTKYNWQGWFTSGEFIAPVEADYAIVVRHVNSVVISDVDVVASKVIIYTNESYNGGINANEAHHIIDTANIRCISHRGYRIAAPENTAPAFVLAKQKGYNWVECDVWPTSDGHYVIIHDPTVDRTSDGTGTVYNMTLQELKSLDFGSWFNPLFAGTKILTFDEFMVLCRGIGVRAYIELKHDTTFGEWTQSQISDLVTIAKNAGMLRNIAWIDFGFSNLLKVATDDPYACLGVLTNDINENTIISFTNIKNATTGETFISANYVQMTANGVALAKNANAKLEVYSANDRTAILECDKYVSGFTAENIIPAIVLYQNAVG